jgi:transcriptional regulator with XRE-family HTH domain
MTPIELIEIRKRLGLSREALARKLEMSSSRLNDYELGFTRGRGTPAPIPRVVELAMERLSQISPLT